MGTASGARSPPWGSPCPTLNTPTWTPARNASRSSRVIAIVAIACSRPCALFRAWTTRAQAPRSRRQREAVLDQRRHFGAWVHVDEVRAVTVSVVPGHLESSRVAGGRDRRRVRVRAERAESGRRVGTADERQRPGVVLAVERRRTREAARRSVGGIVEPKTDVQRLRGAEPDVGIEAEDLIEQDRVDLRLRRVPRRLDVRLIPGEPEVGEPGVGVAIRQLRAALDREEIEADLRLEVLEHDPQVVVPETTADGDGHRRRLPAVGGEARNERGIREQLKREMLVRGARGERGT